MSRRRRTLLLSIAALVLLGGFLLLRSRPGNGPEDGLAPRDEPERAPTSDTAALVVAPEAGLRVPAERPDCVLLVKSDAGDTLLRARAYRCGSSARQLTLDDPTLVGVGDEDGRILAGEALCAERSCVVVVAPGHPPVRVELDPQEGEPHRVRLPSGHAQAFEGVLPDGKPCGGYTVWLSNVVLPAELLWRRQTTELPAWPPEHAIHGGTAGPDGTLVIEGLPAGTYGPMPTAEGMTPIAINRGVLDVPGEPVRITFAPLYVFALETDGDEVISNSMSFSGWMLWQPAFPLLKLHERELQARFPEALLRVAARLRSPDAMTWPTATLHLKRKGTHEVQLEGVPLADFVAPQRLDCTGFDEEPLAEARVRVFDAQGFELPPDEFVAKELVAARGRDMFSPPSYVPDREGMFHLPEGEYGLFFVRPWLEKAKGPRRFAAPSTFELHLPIAMRLCRLDLELPWGDVADEVVWSITAAHGRQSYEQGGGVRWDVLLPTGPASFTAQAFGLPAVTAEVEILPGPWETPQHIRLRCPPEGR